MKFLQTTLFAGLFIALAICLYQAVVTSRLRTEIQIQHQQQVRLNAQIAELQTSLDTAHEATSRANEETQRLKAQLRRAAKAPTRQQQQPDAAGPPALGSLFGGDGTNGLFGSMSKLMDVMLDQQVDSKMATLKARLNLSPDQEVSIRELLLTQSKAGSDMAQQIFSGKGVNTNLFAQAGTMTSENQIKALLTPEQATAYDAVQKEEQSSNARLMANAELLQLQSVLQLNEDQQDKVFAVLADQAQTQFLDPSPNPGAAPDFQGMLQRKVDALRPLLTPDQLERYQKFQQQQLDMIQAITGSLGKSSGQ